MNYKIITISREFGSGGRLIGKKLAEIMNIPYYDKEIISLTAKQSGFSEAIIEREEQKKTNSLLYNLYMTSQELPVTDQIFIVQSKIIQEVSQKGPCIIVGRCADYTLRDAKSCLRVFIHAPIQERIRRVREDYKEEDKKLENLIRKEDKRRATYYNHFTQNKWGDSHNYHLSIDSSIGIEQSVQLIQFLAQGGSSCNNKQQ